MRNGQNYAVWGIAWAGLLEGLRWLLGKSLDSVWPEVAEIISEIPPYLFAGFAAGALFSFLMLGGWKGLRKKPRARASDDSVSQDQSDDLESPARTIRCETRSYEESVALARIVLKNRFGDLLTDLDSVQGPHDGEKWQRRAGELVFGASAGPKRRASRYARIAAVLPAMMQNARTERRAIAARRVARTSRQHPGRCSRRTSCRSAITLPLSRSL